MPDAGDRPGLRAPLIALTEAPARSAVLSDFDGTLAPIVADPDTAEPLPGVLETLAALAERYAVVGVVSGRPVSFLTQRLAGAGARVRLFGVYGMEWIEDGALHRHPDVESWREPAARVVAAGRAAFAGTGVSVEDKGATVTVHWRGAPDAEAQALAFAREWAQRTGFVLQPGRRAVEFRPPLDIDKGSVVEQLAAGCAAACFIGDDAGDLAAFRALDRLAASGTRAVRVAVEDAESPPALVAAADVVVRGPTEALALLRGLLGG